MFNIGTIDFEIYEDGVRIEGVTAYTLPNKVRKTIVVNGAGLGGDIESAITGQYEPMEASFNFRGYSRDVAKISEPRRHTVDLRVAEQHEDPLSGEVRIARTKHIMVIIPKSKSGGNVQNATANETVVATSVRYWATYVDGRLTELFDPANGIDIINGFDYGEEVRKALGK